MKTILVTPRGYATFGQEIQKELEALGYTMDVNTTGKPLPREAFVEKAKQATGIIVGVDELDESLLRACKNLKAIVKFGVGTDNIDVAVCEELNIKVGRCLGTNSNAVAEFTIGLMFSAARYIAANAIEVKQGEWSKPTGIELFGKKVGIFGFGNIGKQVARMAKGIGMDVVVFDVFDIPTSELEKYDAKQVKPSEIFSTCDFITLHVPLNDETKNLVSTKEFKDMKKSAILINAARGGIVDEAALYEALKDKEILACASDVFSSEPPEKAGWKQDLLQLDNFILTAHIASRSQESEINTVKVATSTMIELLKV